MAAQALDLQQKARGNAQQLQDYLLELQNWEQDIAKRDEALTAAAKNYQHEHKFPVRSKEMVAQVDQAAAENEMEILKQKAVAQKNEGNDFFKAGKYEEAVSRYTTAAEFDPNDPVLPANRAMALLKLGRFTEAEKDCDRALTLDAGFVKAYHRRGVARTGLGRSDAARQDFRKVLDLEPHNRAAQVELEKLVTRSSALLDEPKPKEDILKITPKVTDAPKGPTSSSSSSSSSSPPFVIEEYFETTPVTDGAADDADQEPVTVSVVTDTQQQEAAIEKLVRALGQPSPPQPQPAPLVLAEKTPPPQAQKAVDERPQQPAQVLPPAPKNYFQFQREWKTLRHRPDLRFQFLKLIGAGNLWRVLGDSLETDVLADVVATLRDRPAGDQEPLLPWLDGLSKIKRISAVVMLLSASQRSDMEILLQSVEKDAGELDMQRLRQKLL